MDSRWSPAGGSVEYVRAHLTAVMAEASAQSAERDTSGWAPAMVLVTLSITACSNRHHHSQDRCRQSSRERTVLNSRTLGNYPPSRVPVYLHGSLARPPVVYNYGPTPDGPFEKAVNSRAPQWREVRAAEEDSGNTTQQCNELARTPMERGTRRGGRLRDEGVPGKPGHATQDKGANDWSKRGQRT